MRSLVHAHNYLLALESNGYVVSEWHTHAAQLTVDYLTIALNPLLINVPESELIQDWARVWATDGLVGDYVAHVPSEDWNTPAGRVVALSTHVGTSDYAIVLTFDDVLVFDDEGGRSSLLTAALEDLTKQGEYVTGVPSNITRVASTLATLHGANELLHSNKQGITGRIGLNRFAAGVATAALFLLQGLDEATDNGNDGCSIY